MAATVKVARQQTTPELSGTFRTLPPEPTPAYTGTLRNLPEPSGTCLRNLHHFTPELSGTFRNLPPELTPFYKGTLRNLLEPASGTYTSTLRNLPPEPAPATRTGTHRSLSGLKTPLAYAVGEKKNSERQISPTLKSNSLCCEKCIQYHQFTTLFNNQLFWTNSQLLKQFTSTI